MNNFTKRILTGMVLAGVVISLVSAGTYSFLLLLLTINSLGLLEFYRLFKSPLILSRRSCGLFLSIVILLAVFLALSGHDNYRVLLVIVPVAFFLFVMELYLKADNPFHNLAITFLGIICITIPLSFFLGMAFLPLGSGGYHPDVILGCFFLLWTSDAGAYVFGNLLGKHKLFKRISPQKTWEGSIGGTISTLLVAYLVSLFFKSISLNYWLIIAGIIIVTGTLGDLIKSMMKRSLNVKDTGTILPGHGGILDRFDSLLGSAPFVYAYLILFCE